MRHLLACLVFFLALTPRDPIWAQVHAHDHTSPYADFLDREIKALPDDEVEGLLNGAGLGMALAAELNRYPGPRHVLEMGPMLGLSSAQESTIRAIFEEMQERARTLGKEIVELERELDVSFAEGTIREDHLRQLLDSIGVARAELRFTHLRAHLQLFPVLTELQRDQYLQARGYGG